MTSPKRAAAVQVAAAVLLLAPAMLAQGERVSLEEVRTSFLLREGEDQRSDAQVVAELSALGDGAVVHLFRLYAGGSELDRFFALDDAPQRERRWWSSPDRYGRVAERALVEGYEEATLQHLRALASAASTSEDDRLALLRLTASLATPAALQLWGEVASELAEPVVVGNLTRVTIQQSLAAHLERADDSYSLLRGEALSGFPRALREEVARAAARAEDPRSLWLLGQLLEEGMAGQEGPALDQLVGQIDPLVRCWPWVLGEDWPRRLFLLAGDLRTDVRLAAIDALAGHASAFALLADRAEGAFEASERRLALGCLSRSFGGGIRDVDEWELHVEREKLWWESRGAAQVDTLVEATPASAAPILRELAAHTGYRARVAERLAATLPDLSLDVSRGVLVFLADLGEPSAVPPLIEALASMDRELAPRIARTLELLTGQSNGRDPSAWRSALALRG